MATVILPVDNQSIAGSVDRSTYIGSADIASICGVPGSFGSPYEVASRKKHLIPPLEMNEAMEIGLALEDYVLSRYQREEGVKIGAVQVFCRHPDWVQIGCTVDALVFDADGVPTRIVEAKTTGDYKWDEIPLKYECQVQWQMGILGVDEADLTVLHLPNKQMKTYRIKFSPVVFDSMLDKAIEFWRYYVERPQMPPIDGHHATTDALKLIQATAGKMLNVDGLAARIEDLKVAKAIAKDADNAVEAITNELREALGDAEIGLIDGKTAISWKTSKTSRLDTKSLKADMPEVYQQYTTETESRTFRINTGSK